MRLEKLSPEHYTALFWLMRACDPLCVDISPEQFWANITQSQGFVVMDNTDNVIGKVTFSDIVPQCNAIIHATVYPQYRKRWLTKSIIRQVFDFAFNVLRLRRVSGFELAGQTPEGGQLLRRLGFKKEGNIRCGYRKLDGSYGDIITYGILREECRWIKGG